MFIKIKAEKLLTMRLCAVHSVAVFQFCMFLGFSRFLDFFQAAFILSLSGCARLLELAQLAQDKFLER